MADYTKGCHTPGGVGEVTAEFDSNHGAPGEVHKTITVQTNTFDASPHLAFTELLSQMNKHRQTVRRKVLNHNQKIKQIQDEPDERNSFDGSSQRRRRPEPTPYFLNDGRDYPRVLVVYDSPAG